MTDAEEVQLAAERMEHMRLACRAARAALRCAVAELAAFIKHEGPDLDVPDLLALTAARARCDATREELQTLIRRIEQ